MLSGPVRPLCEARLPRLYACACVRRVWHLLADARSRGAVEVFERYADGLATEEEWLTAGGAAWDATADVTSAAARAAARAAAWAGVSRQDRDVPGGLARKAASDAAGYAAGAARDAEEQVQAALERHIYARARPDRPQRPQWLVGMALWVYDTGDGWYALADALEELGDAELAEHFRAETWHPKGCWALDTILGK